MQRRIALAILLVLAAPGFAEQVTWRDYTIYYTTFRSTLIPPEVAEQHGITRGERRILTNITIRQQGEPVRADVSGTATNLLNQSTPLEFAEVIEEAAIYYLANQLVDERDTLRYQLRIQPQGETAALDLEFTRRYYHGDTP